MSLVDTVVQRHRPLVLATHPRSGTHLLIDTLRRNSPDCASSKLPGESLSRLYLNIDAVRAGNVSVASALATLVRCRRPLVKTHMYPGFDEHVVREAIGRHGAALRDALEAAEVVCVVRDVRDVLCSQHLFMKGASPKARVPIGEFIRQEVAGMSRPRRWAHFVETWLARSGDSLVSFERLVRDTRAALGEVAERHGLSLRLRDPLLPAKAEAGSVALSIRRRLAIRPKSTAILGRAPGHELQRWREAFDESDRELVEREAGLMLRRLGYVESDDWVTRPSS